MIQFKALLKKELKEAFRDKRAFAIAMMMAFMAPIMVLVMSKVAIDKFVDTPDIYIKVAGAEFAPKLIKKFADEHILLFKDVPADNKRNWDERNINLVIPDTFSDDMIDGKTIDITLTADFSEQAIRAPLRRVKDTIREYSQEIGYKRLLVRGIDVRLLRTVNVVEQDTALPSSNFVMISMMLGIYLLMAAFMSGLSVAIDSSAGERERDVLEMLLCQPVSTLKIVMAKLSTASFIAAIAVVLTIVLTSIAVQFVDLTKIGATFSLDLYTISILLILMLPICFFASSIQLFVAFHAKSFKEAQSSVTMIIMLPAMVPFILMNIDDKPPWLDWTPIAAQSMLMEDLFKGLPVSWVGIGFTSIVTIAMTAVLVYGLAAKLKSEKVIQSLS